MKSKRLCDCGSLKGWAKDPEVPVARRGAHYYVEYVPKKWHQIRFCMDCGGNTRVLWRSGSDRKMCRCGLVQQWIRLPSSRFEKLGRFGFLMLDVPQTRKRGSWSVNCCPECGLPLQKLWRGRPYAKGEKKEMHRLNRMVNPLKTFEDYRRRFGMPDEIVKLDKQDHRMERYYNIPICKKEWVWKRASKIFEIRVRQTKENKLVCHFGFQRIKK